MDRDNRWDRIEKAYDLVTLGIADINVSSTSDGLKQAYEKKLTDEFVCPISTTDSTTTIDNGDTVIFMNFRADRARELTRTFTAEVFTGFERKKRPKLRHFVTLTEYDSTLNTTVAYPPITVKNGLSETISNAGLKQVHIAETEKYAHVTFFFNGGIEENYTGEYRLLVPSPDVATYDFQPEMSAPHLTEKLVTEIKNKSHDFIVCNFANPDMVGHTGNFDATVKAIETIDTCLEEIVAALKKVGGELLITADHGNAELMFNHKNGQPHTAHTHGNVPLLYVGRETTFKNIDAKLADIAPTLLNLMGLEKPPEMTGRSLLDI
jgi:2,3-bisphosphoglycerate-independent phosphoglycerate mutase